METNHKRILCEIEIPYNKNLESILNTIEGYNVEFNDRRKSGILKIDLDEKVVLGGIIRDDLPSDVVSDLETSN